MGWFHERKETVLAAFTLRRVVAIPIVIAVITVVVRGSAALSEFLTRGEGRMLLGVPSWMWGLIAGLLLALYFVIEYATHLRLTIKPTIDVQFNPDAEGIVQTRTEIYEHDKKIRDDVAKYIRITLIALSPKTVKGCAVFLTKLEKRFIPTGQFIDIPIRGALSLTQNPVDVYPRVPTTVDFLKTGQFDNKLGGTIGWPFRMDGALDDKATYRFTIEVIGDDIAKNICVEIDWAGQWNTIAGRKCEK
jgi:hypothetical protein